MPAPRPALVAVALAAIAVPTVAQAQDAPGALAPAPVAEAVDPTLALGLSAGTTAVGLAASLAALETHNENLLLAGVITTFVGPSVGHLVSREVWSRGLGLRLLGAASAATGAYLYFSSGVTHGDDHVGHPDLGAGLFWAGVGLAAVGVVDDILTAPGAARRYNHAVAARRIAVTPTLAPGHAGLAVAGTF